MDVSRTWELTVFDDSDGSTRKQTKGGNGSKRTTTRKLSWLTSWDEPEPAGARVPTRTVARPPIWPA